MMTTHKSKKKPTESVTGRYFALPHAVLDSVAYVGAGFATKALLMDIARQHSGINNGHLHAVFSWLKPRGWASSATVIKSLNELIARGLIVKTRMGGLHAGRCLYALTWLDITDYRELDIDRAHYPKGKYILLDAPPTIQPQKQKRASDSESSTPATDSDSELRVTAIASDYESVGHFSNPAVLQNMNTMNSNQYLHGECCGAVAVLADLTRERDTDRMAGSWDHESGEFVQSGIVRNRQTILSECEAVTWH
jgi:hypothetical protein